jgi:hypothetical protein
LHAGSVKQFKNGVSYVSMLYVQKHTKHTHDTHTYIDIYIREGDTYIHRYIRKRGRCIYTYIYIREGDRNIHRYTHKRARYINT